MITLRVEQLLKDDEFELGLTVLAGQGGLGRTIEHDKIQRPGLAFTGYTEFLQPRRVQVLGNSELTYLRQLADDAARDSAVRHLVSRPLACVVVTKGLAVPEELIRACEDTGTPLLQTRQMSSTFTSKMQAFLEEKLAPQTA